MSKIFVQDNFFPQKEYSIICEELLNIHYVVPDKVKREIQGGTYWHTHTLPSRCEVKDLIRNLIKKYFLFTTNSKKHKTMYTMVGATDKPRPHIDDCEAQCLIYMIGDEKLNNGTAFYTKEKDKDAILNSHIGFKRNRAIFFTGGTYHCPLHPFAKEGESSWRYSIVNFLNEPTPS
jgi:hypothetical protein